MIDRAWTWLTTVKWWILHRTFYRFHVIKPRSLKPGYYDPDTRIRAAAFDTMSEYAESLMGDGIKGTKWTEEEVQAFEDEESIKMVREQIDTEAKIIELRNWWVEYRPRRDNTADDLLMDIDFGSPESDSIVVISEDNEKLKKYNDFIRVSELEDKAKFIELIELLPDMWY